ncbi:MAG: prephenate dehydratase [Bdellovibrionales bacterium]
MKVSFQGQPGAYSEAALLHLFPQAEPLPCPSFAEAFAAVQTGAADRAVIPVENRIAGRVADVHSLLPGSGLHIVGEHYEPIDHHLLAVPGATLEGIGTALSHEQALTQVRGFLTKHNITPVVFHDTAGGAAEVALRGNPTIAAVASARAGAAYGLITLATGISDNPANMTRFLVLSRTPDVPAVGAPVITSLEFTLRSIPAALYKALGGFATSGINLTKIESYLSEKDFTSASFYIDIEAHPGEDRTQHALDELRFFTSDIRILGTYPQGKRPQ